MKLIFYLTSTFESSLLLLYVLYRKSMNRSTLNRICLWKWAIDLSRRSEAVEKLSYTWKCNKIWAPSVKKQSLSVMVRLCVSMVRDLKVTLFCLRSLASENGSKSWSQIRTRLELTNSYTRFIHICCIYLSPVTYFCMCDDICVMTHIHERTTD